jgi:superfamily II DNA or RNA helicase
VDVRNFVHRPLSGIEPLFNRSNEMNARVPSFEQVKSPGLRKRPLPHQLEALDGIGTVLAEGDRAKVVKACGTGKTLTAMWAVQRQRARTAIVLVPSLALLAQTYRAWRSEFQGAFRHMCVCSDRNVDASADDVALSSEEVREFRASTDPSAVRSFMAEAWSLAEGSPGAVSVIFCTYDSAPVIAEAQRLSAQEGADYDPSFDIAIFDEAHKTAGAAGKRYAFALRDGNLLIRKRLFFTATEKLVESARAIDDAAGGAVVSMDDESLYGRPAYKLGFAEAAERGLITPFQVVVSYVNDAGLSLAELDSPRTRLVANARALLHAMQVTGARKVISFHSRIANAQAFSDEIARTASVPTFHVNGSYQTSTHRELQLRAFDSAATGVMTNARCLTEGVDVPTVDMVALMNPGESSIDIAQAAGRSLRNAPGKTLGYVFVPIHADLAGGETIDQAIDRADFRPVMDVLRSLIENDGLPIPASTRLRGVFEPRGHNEPLLKVIADGVLGVEAELVVAAIRARILKLAQKSKSFEERLEQITEFAKVHGHCVVPKSHPGDLRSWVFAERVRAKRPGYSSERRRQLNAIGFAWDLHEAKWCAKFVELSAYQQKHGHCDVPKSDGPLGKWVGIQRAVAKSRGYSDARRAKLDSIGFHWQLHECVPFEELISELTAYKLQHGHLTVSQRLPLGKRFERARAAWREGRLDDRQVRRLIDLGVRPDKAVFSPRERIEQARAFHLEHRHLRVPRAHPSGLHGWLGNQTRAQRRGELARDVYDALAALGLFSDKRNDHASEDDRATVPETCGSEYGIGSDGVSGRGEFVGGLAASQTRSQKLWFTSSRVTLAPLVEMRERYRKDAGLPFESSRQIAALFEKQFIRLKDMELIPFGDLATSDLAELTRLCAEFVGLPVEVPTRNSETNGDSDAEERAPEAPRG